MKMKFTLIAAAVAMLGFSASAQSYRIASTGEDLTKLLTPSNTTKAKERTEKKQPGIQGSGTASHKNVLVSYFLEDGTTADKLGDWVYGEYGPDGTTIGMYADGTSESMRFRYNTGNLRRSDMKKDRWMIGILTKGTLYEGLTGVNLKLVVGPKPEGATTDYITPRVVFNTIKDPAISTETRYDVVYTFDPIQLTDQQQELDVVSFECTGDGKGQEGAPLNVNYVDLYIDDISAGQFVAYKQIGWIKGPFYPKVGFDTQTTRELGFRGVQETQPGTIFIQAEDFDCVKEGEPLNRSTVCAGIDAGYTDAYGNPNEISPTNVWAKYFPTRGDLSQIRTDAAQNKTGYGIFQTYADGFSSKNEGLGFALIGMSKRTGDWGTLYGGEYLDETSNKISLEQAMDGFGAWFEYTFEMEEDGYVDISIAASSHAATTFNDVLTGGSRAQGGNYVTKYKKPREEGGYEVEGLDDDFLKLYGFSYVVSFDGEEQLTNWESRPMPSKFNGAISGTAWTNPFEWDASYDVDAAGNQVNSKFLLITPPHATFDGGMQWWPLYKSDMIKEMYDMQVGTGTFDADNKEIMGESPFKKQCDELGEDYFANTYKDRPDYANIPCTAGKHTIRVKSMGGATIFDEIRIRAHKEREKDFSGINAVRNIIETEAEGPAEYFDLQGRRVMCPANGLYIVKRGNKVTKEVIK